MNDLQILADWQKWFEDFVIEDINKALGLEAQNQPSLEIGLIILSLIGVEALSGYFAGKKADKKTFVEFVEHYFPPSYRGFSTAIYESLRNGLAHDYIVKEIDISGQKVVPFVLNGKEGEPHLVPHEAGKPFPIAFNRIAIAKDFCAAWTQYVSDVYADPDLRRKLVARAIDRGYMKVGPT